MWCFLCDLACKDNIQTVLGPNLLWQNVEGDLGTGSGHCPPAWQDVLAIADPLFYGPEDDNYAVASNSPALTDSMTFGCYPDPGCSSIPPSLAPATWKRITKTYH